jgi:hypothetical protein
MQNYRIDYFSSLNQKRKILINEELNKIIESTDSIITIAHNIDLLNILSTFFGYKSDILLFRNNNKLEGFIPIVIIGKKVVSIPHFSYGGYLGLKKLELNQTKLIIDSLERKYGNNIVIRDFNKITNFYSEDKVSCFLKLEGNSEKQFNNFTSKLRSQIRKSEKNGLKVSLSNIDDFFPVYLANMHRLGSPHLSKKFFDKIEKNYKNGEFKIFVVKKENLVISVSIVLTFKNFIEVCWAASYKQYNYLAPNMLIYWKMIQYGIDHNMKIFSFGRSTKNSGPLKFKKQWGAEEIQLIWNFNKAKYFNINQLKFLTFIWKKLPQSLIEILGPFFTKYIY